VIRRVVAAAVVLAAVAAPVVLGPGTLRGVAVVVLLALAAVGLAVTVNGAGVPSLAHGAFLGLGMYTSAIVQTRYGWNPLAGLAAAALVGVGAGAIVGAGVARLRPAFAALVTWLLAWTFGRLVGDLSWLTGGARGIVLGPAVLDLGGIGRTVTITSTGWWEITVALAVLTLVLLAAFRNRFGSALGFMREDPAAALAHGLPVRALRLRAVAMPAALAAVTGAVLVQVQGVADPTRVGAIVSGQLFVVVLLGGTVGALGPVVALLLLFAVELLMDAVIPAAAAPGIAGAAAAVALVAVFAALPQGIVPAVTQRLRRRDTPMSPPPPVAAGTDLPPPARRSIGPVLTAEGITLDFSHGRVLDGVDLQLYGGECLGVVGPNGSGKTMLLRVLAGNFAAAGTAAITDRPLPAEAWARRRIGVSRSTQRAVDAPLTPRELVLAGMEARRPRNTMRVLWATPQARAEQRRAHDSAAAMLRICGLDDVADIPVSELDLTRRRLAHVAAALAGEPAVVLLDEPTAGLDEPGTQAVVALVRRVVGLGAAVLVVEHDVRALRGAADRVIALIDGRVAVEGSLDQVLADPAVAAGWLGAHL
jgi:branched-chain amino acid transport system permease protein